MGYLVPMGFRYGTLRALEPADADGMLEWMHNPQIAGVFDQNFMLVTREEALAFIESSHADSNSLHFAIAGSDDEYLGTVSLKKIGEPVGKAEYAIATRKCAHGTGIAARATEDMLSYAFNVLGLEEVFLCVRPTNGRAIAFYEKMGFERTEGHVDNDRLLWYRCAIN